jgi:hypothetical protein
VAVPVTNGVAGKPVKDSDITSLFYAVACVTSTECVIAGTGAVKGGDEAQVWLLRGRKLTLIRQSDANAYVTASFRGVTCRSAKYCLAVGDATYESKTNGQQPTAVFGDIYLTGSPSVRVVDNTTLGYAASVSCPSASMCYSGGATAAGAGAIADISLKSGDITGPFAQPTVSGLDGLACASVSACGAAEVENLTFPASAGWVERINERANGTPAAVTGAQLMFGIAVVNSGYYLAVGSATGGSWLTDLMTASGRALAPDQPDYAGYLQAISCPVQTECIAAGFSSDPAANQPGGLDGTDGAIAVFRLRTAPSPPRLSVRSKTSVSVTLRLSPPGNDGGETITGYQLAVSRCKPGRKACQLEPVKTVHVAAGKRTVTVTGLASGTRYYFQARATNSIGAGPYSRSVSSKG